MCPFTTYIGNYRSYRFFGSVSLLLSTSVFFRFLNRRRSPAVFQKPRFRFGFLFSVDRTNTNPMVLPLCGLPANIALASRNNSVKHTFGLSTGIQLALIINSPYSRSIVHRKGACLPRTLPHSRKHALVHTHTLCERSVCASRPVCVRKTRTHSKSNMCRQYARNISPSIITISLVMILGERGASTTPRRPAARRAPSLPFRHL